MKNLKNSVVVLPYTETSRLFTASVSKKLEAFIGENGIEYYQHLAKRMTEIEAKAAVDACLNKEAFVRTI